MNDYRRIQEIQRVVCAYFGILKRPMMWHRQDSKWTYPRQLAMYLSRKHTKESLPSIAEDFNRCHQTILHAVRKITRLSIIDSTVKTDITNIESLLPWMQESYESGI